MSENEKLFPYPFTVDTLPPHRARQLTQAQRDALQAVELRPDFPGKGFLSLGTPDEGRFVLYPERMNANSPQCSCRCRSLHVPASNGSLNQNTGRGSLTNGTL